jgi:hypothetical protein
MRALALIMTVFLTISFGNYATAQTCHIITSTGACSSVNVVIPGVLGTGSAVCTTSGVYGDPVGTIIGPIFLTVVASQTCSPDSGVMSVTQRASTAVDLNDTAIDGLRSSVVDDNGRTLFRSHGEQDCATGFSETIEVDDPTACTPIPPAPPPTDPCLGGGDPNTFTDGDESGPAPDCSPLIIDIAGNGFELTSATNGVRFDISGTGVPIQIAWTANANNAFLVLDRNGNGIIDSGAEMFGNFSPQPSSDHPNGFLALAQYDKPENGGNGDGIIDAHDQIFSSLRLWIDANHDGITQPGELHSLPELGVFSIGLSYSLSMRTDEFGNVFRYRAKINEGVHGPQDVGKQIYDVFFVTR